MTKYHKGAGLTALTLLIVGCLVPKAVNAQGNEDSPQIMQLLADAKTEAFQLRMDAEDMDAFARSGVSWQSHAKKVASMREHINESGKILAQLHDLKSTGSRWQQMAIDGIDPLLRELAVNIEKTINHLNENQSKVHLPEFKEYVRDNYDLAVPLDTLIRDYIDYTNVKERFERLEEKTRT